MNDNIPSWDNRDIQSHNNRVPCNFELPGQSDDALLEEQRSFLKRELATFDRHIRALTVSQIKEMILVISLSGFFGFLVAWLMREFGGQ